MRIDAIHYKPHTLSLRTFKFFFQKPHWFLQLWRSFIKWYVMRKKWSSTKLWPLCIHNGGCFETLNLPRVSTVAVVAKCLHFVMFYMKQNKKRKQTLKSVQYGLEIIFILNQFNNVQVLLFELLHSHANILKQLLQVDRRNKVQTMKMTQVHGCCLRKFLRSPLGSFHQKLGAQATFLGAQIKFSGGVGRLRGPGAEIFCETLI